MAEFESSWLAQVPPGSSAIDDREFHDGIERLISRGQRDLRDVWYWTRRLSLAVDQVDEALVGLRSISRVAVGFIEELDGAFGLIVYCDTPQSDSDDSPRVPRARTDAVVVDGVSFPSIVREAPVEEHWCTAPGITSPTYARAACWVRLSHQGVEGWLVPRHAIQPPGSVVTFTSGDAGYCVHSFGACVDAAVIASAPPAHVHHPAIALWPLVPGQQLLVSDHPHSYVPASVLDVDLNLGVLRHLIFPVRFTIDWTGVPGQSGALIVDQNTNETAGMYLGVLNPLNGASSPFGYAQSCYQLADATGMEFYL